MTERRPDEGDEDVTSEAPTEYLRSAPRSWSRPAEDLSRESLLRHAARVELDGVARPGMTGRIALLSKLGQGGMGVVYHGVHVRLGTEVAVKLLPLAMQARGDDLVQRFEREAQIAARLHSPHLVRVVDIDEDPATGCHFIVMEYVDGPSADRWAADLGRPTTEADALDLCIAATRGLAAAHVEGIVHRDVKPANILVPRGADGRPRIDRCKLADLGLARAESGGQSLTGTALPMGTPGYMAPEQAEDAKRAAKPADVFGMGATLYALLSGAAPFAGSSLGAALANTLRGKYPPLRDSRPDVTAATAMLVDRCLDQDPAARYPDAPALLDALQYTRSLLTQSAVSDDELSRVMTFAERAEQGKRMASESSPAPVPPPEPVATTPAPPPVAASTASVSPPHTAPGGTVPGATVPAETVPAETAQVATAPPGSVPPPRKGVGVGVLAGAAIAVVALVVLLVSLLGTGETPPPEVTTGTLAVQSRPSQAQVIVDGASVGRTPYVNGEVSAGEHTVVLRLQGHEDARLPARIRAGKRLDLGVIELVATTAERQEEPRPGTQTGTLAVQSRPSGAEVLLGDVRVGRTPFVSADTPVGQHTVTLRLAGHGDERLPARIKAGQRLDLGVIALTAWGVAVPGTYGADVRATLDGEPFTAPTPLPSGSGEVVLVRTGYQRQTIDVSVRPGERRVVEAGRWHSLGGTLDLTRLPADATVEVDGRPYRARDELGAGPHRVKVSRPGYEPQEVGVEVRPGAAAVVPLRRWERAALRYLWRAGQAFRITTAGEYGTTTHGSGFGARNVSMVTDFAESRTATSVLQVQSVEANGDAWLSYRFERMFGSGVSQGESYTFDTDRGEGSPQVLEQIGATVRVLVTPRGRVSDVRVGEFRSTKSDGTRYTEHETASMARASVRSLLPIYEPPRAVAEPGAAWSVQLELFNAGAEFRENQSYRVQRASATRLELELRAGATLLRGEVDGLEGWRLTSLGAASQFTIDRADGLPRRVEVEGEITYSGGGELTMKHDWDGTITWEPISGDEKR